MASVARYCCCGGCLPQVKVTVAGIDGNMCCLDYNAGLDSIKIENEAINGVYTLPAFSPTQVPPVCDFRDIIDTPDAVRRNGTTCAGSIIASFGWSVRMLVRMTDASTIASVSMFDVTQPILNGSIFTASGTWSLGDTISNQLVCPTNYFGAGGKIMCQSGTVVVEKV